MRHFCCTGFFVSTRAFDVHHGQKRRTGPCHPPRCPTKITPMLLHGVGEPERRARFNMDSMMNSNTEPMTLGETGLNSHRDPYRLHDPADGRDCLCDGCQANYGQDAVDDHAAREEDTRFREENERGRAEAQKGDWFGSIASEFRAHPLLSHQSLLCRLHQSTADRTRELPWGARQFLLGAIRVCWGALIVEALLEVVWRRVQNALPSETQGVPWGPWWCWSWQGFSWGCASICWATYGSSSRYSRCWGRFSSFRRRGRLRQPRLIDEKVLVPLYRRRHFIGRRLTRAFERVRSMSSGRRREG